VKSFDFMPKNAGFRSFFSTLDKPGDLLSPISVTNLNLISYK